MKLIRNFLFWYLLGGKGHKSASPDEDSAFFPSYLVYLQIMKMPFYILSKTCFWE